MLTEIENAGLGLELRGTGCGMWRHTTNITNNAVAPTARSLNDGKDLLEEVFMATPKLMAAFLIYAADINNN